MNRGLKIAVGMMTALVLLLGGFVVGVVAEKLINRPIAFPSVGSDRTDADRLFGRVREIIRDDSLRPSSEESITANGISGMLKSLDDPYALYLDPRHLKYFQEQTDGEFFGIGVTLSVNEGRAVVVQPLKNTPAMKAGLRAGDEIVKIDGWSKKGWTSEEVVSRVRGPEGTKVKLLMRRKGVKDFEVSIVRAKIETPNIETEKIGGDVGYVRLFSFNGNAADEVRTAIADMDKQGAKGYILDLRENPGGLLKAGVDVGSLFIKEGPIVRVDERGKPEVVHGASGNIATKKPLVVLIDENSASASEILAGALQDYGRAKLVGAKSYGKGSVQSVFDLANGGAVKLTIAHYLTPKGRSIDRKGLSPDLLVPMDPERQAEKKTDAQLQAAIRTLQDAIGR